MLMTRGTQTMARPAFALGAIEFCAWVGQALPGDRLEYHRGFLGIDTTPVISALREQDRCRVAALADSAHRAFEADLVHLVQERLGPDRFAYIAIARPRPKGAPASVSSLLLEAQAA